MNVFHKKFNKRIAEYAAATAKAQEAERKLIAEFESIDRAEIDEIIDIMLDKAHPNHIEEIKRFAERFRVTKTVTGDDIVTFRTVAEANRQHIEEGDSK